MSGIVEASLIECFFIDWVGDDRGCRAGMHIVNGPRDRFYDGRSICRIDLAGYPLDGCFEAHDRKRRCNAGGRFIGVNCLDRTIDADTSGAFGEHVRVRQTIEWRQTKFLTHGPGGQSYVGTNPSRFAHGQREWRADKIRFRRQYARHQRC